METGHLPGQRERLAREGTELDAAGALVERTRTWDATTLYTAREALALAVAC